VSEIPHGLTLIRHPCPQSLWGTITLRLVRRTEARVPIDPVAAMAHLRAADPVLAKVIEHVGPPMLRPPSGAPFHALARAIIFQQLSGRAADTIYGRVVAATAAPGEPFPSPRRLLNADEATLRAAGLSRQKTAALRSLAEHFAGGELAAVDLESLSDEDVIALLTRVRGVGRWTAEMFLMFELQRPDVLPVNDLGLNRAIGRLYGLPGLPQPADVRAIGRPWRPWATVACWYLWRSHDVDLPGPAQV
jgi:3-methyladenine DNA glycosylase/8-oxoguanine DNA glycosylase